RATFSRMAIAAVNLGSQALAVRQIDCCLSADSWPPPHTLRRQPWPDLRLGRGAGAHRQHEPEPHKRAWARELVMIEHRGFPLIRHREIQLPVAIDIGCRDPTADIGIV